MRFVEQNGAACGVVAAAAVLFIVGVALPMTGVRPYGERQILEQIEQEDSSLCAKFGLEVGTQKYAGCVHDLADLRQRHVELLSTSSWL